MPPPLPQFTDTGEYTVRYEFRNPIHVQRSLLCFVKEILHGSLVFRVSSFPLQHAVSHLPDTVCKIPMVSGSGLLLHTQLPPYSSLDYSILAMCLPISQVFQYLSHIRTFTHALLTVPGFSNAAYASPQTPTLNKHRFLSGLSFH